MEPNGVSKSNEYSKIIFEIKENIVILRKNEHDIRKLDGSHRLLMKNIIVEESRKKEYKKFLREGSCELEKRKDQLHSKVAEMEDTSKSLERDMQILRRLKLKRIRQVKEEIDVHKKVQNLHDSSVFGYIVSSHRDLVKNLKKLGNLTNIFPKCEDEDLNNEHLEEIMDIVRGYENHHLKLEEMIKFLPLPQQQEEEEEKKKKENLSVITVKKVKEEEIEEVEGEG